MYLQYFQLGEAIVVGLLAAVFIFLLLDLKEQRFLAIKDSKEFRKGTTFASRMILLTDEKRMKLQKEFEKAEIGVTPEYFMLRKIIQGLVTGGITAIVGYYFTHDILVLMIALLLGGYAFYQPTKKLKSKGRNILIQRKLDIPKYAKNLTTLMRTQTTYDAIKESIALAPKSIKPFAEKLLLEISLYPNSNIPFKNFAKNVGVEEVKTYMIILYQALQVSGKNSRQFLEKLEMKNKELEEEAVNMLCESEPRAMLIYNMSIFVCMFLIPTGLAFVTMFNIFSQFK